MIEIETRERDWKVYKVVEGERVSWTRVPNLAVRIEEAVLPAGGIAGLRTREDARGRGYATEVMDAALELKRSEGKALSLLVGIPGFYHRWAYRTAIPLYRLEVGTRALEARLAEDAVPETVPFRDLQPADLETIRRWYERDNHSRTGTLVRRQGVWQGFTKSSNFSKDPVVRVLTREGQARGYVLFDAEVTESLVVAELGCESWPRDLTGLLRILTAEAAARRNGSIILQIPADYPAAHYLRQLRTDLKVTYYFNRHLMARILDLSVLAQAMQPVWERRLDTGRWQGDPQTLVLDTELGSLQLAWDGADLEAAVQERPADPGWVVHCSQQLLCAALFGHVPGSGMAMLGAEIPAGAQELMDVLFPQQQPFMWSADWF